MLGYVWHFSFISWLTFGTRNASQMLTTIIAFYVFPRIIIQYNINVHPLYFTRPQINDFITFQETETRHHWATANSHKADCSSSFLIFLEKLCYLLCDTCYWQKNNVISSFTLPTSQWKCLNLIVQHRICMHMKYLIYVFFRDRIEYMKVLKIVAISEKQFF